MNWKEILDNASPTIKKLNPHLVGVGGLRTAVGKQNSSATLDKESRGETEGQGRVDQGSIRVSLVAYRRKLLDSHDNLPGSCKGLVDEIADWLGHDDKDVKWEYGQLQTNGKQGVMVRIERII